MSPPKAPKKRAVIPRRILPDRVKRVVNPGMPDAKRARRTPAEVTVATEREVESRQATEDLQKKKVWEIAMDELQEENEDSEKSSVVSERHESIERMQDSDDSAAQLEDAVEEDPADKSFDMAAHKNAHTTACPRLE
jgi:3-methyladenine DNA glycosylase/8-oxoguanine DNA glycosylase